MMAGCMVTLGGVGSGMSWSSAYSPRGGRLRGGRVGSFEGDTSLRLRLREDGVGPAVAVVGGPVGTEDGACGYGEGGTVAVAEGE